ncbi:hypothetical protein [Calothrix sp. 336/3]|uniref:hypothetical protein n=1 Tax=Calothrix sp. 336/3 TaxID=1337936 RepID=UPI00054F8B59|nr:hypothetical protein [Calothrix sp. 336/3]AKG21828.1 hypothetical protein IJ00_11660 [Calothrix sp. 336/3]
MLMVGGKIRIAQVIVLLGIAAPLWLVTETIAPQVVRAYTARVDLALDRLPQENYETLLRRAEAAARAAAQRSFDQDILVSDVSVMISAQNYGAIAPVLELVVSRQQWRSRPDPQRWAKYYKSARSLLYFGNNFVQSVPAETLPVTTPPVATPPANQPEINIPKTFTAPPAPPSAR